MVQNITACSFSSRSATMNARGQPGYHFVLFADTEHARRRKSEEGIYTTTLSWINFLQRTSWHENKWKDPRWYAL